MKQSLLNALRKGTQVVLKIDSYDIVLTPHTKTSSPGGVYDNVTQPDRASQKFYFEPLGVSATGSGDGRTGSGAGAAVRQFPYELVGPYDCEMAINDTWTMDGTIYEITSIKPFNGYERRATVAAIGADPSYGE